MNSAPGRVLLKVQKYVSLCNVPKKRSVSVVGGRILLAPLTNQPSAEMAV